MSCRPRLFTSQLGPDPREVVGPLILATDSTVSGQFEADTVFRRRQPILVPTAPLPYLRVVFDVVAKFDHARTELRHSQGARRRKV